MQLLNVAQEIIKDEIKQATQKGCEQKGGVIKHLAGNEEPDISCSIVYTPYNFLA
jgi:hypothetical protein